MAPYTEIHKHVSAPRYHPGMVKQQGISAWLVTWDFAGDHAREALKRITGTDEELVAVLSPRLGPEKVRRFVEQRHSDIMYSPSEQIAYAKGSFNPYPAQFGETTGQIVCGHNPMLYARKVRLLRADGDDGFLWDELPPLPDSVRQAFERARAENRAADSG
jgi:hypothetical protein